MIYLLKSGVSGSWKEKSPRKEKAGSTPLAKNLELDANRVVRGVVVQLPSTRLEKLASFCPLRWCVR